MSSTLVLDGPDWKVREALGLSWQWYVTGREDAPGWLPARVAGSVVDDLHRAGEVPDPYRGRGSRAAEWVAERSWVYRRAVQVPALRDGEHAVVELDGVDPSATVCWDGVEVGRTSGIYRPARIDVTAGCREPGRHLLSVVVHPAPASEPQVGRTDRVRVHAPRMGYGWDFCPRLRHQGIWRSARLVVGAVQLRDVCARTELDPGLTRGRVHLRGTVEAPADAGVDVEAVLYDGNRVLARQQTALPAGAGARPLTLSLEVAEPEPWQPRGCGRARLYTVELRARGSDQAVWRRDVGFRHVAMVTNPGAPAGALPYTAVVNGRKVPLTGWNWVPADVLYGAAPRERVQHLVDLAARSGARLLRVWGGGLVETDDFYDACDRAGLLVWQELSQSSSGMQSAPAEDPAFVALMQAEAEAVVPARTSHPSLLIWGGGNELAADGVPLDEQGSPVLSTLRDAVTRLDPGRHWVATSPTGPASLNRLDIIAADPQAQHDVHGPWEHQGLVDQHTLYNRGTSLAHTEFGVEGMANLRTLCAVVPEDQRWPVDRSNPVYRHLGDWWNNADLVQACFGGRLGTVEQVQRASQLLHATGLGYAVEADRRRAPRCSMVLPWQLNESYPNAWCTSSVDYRGDAKPAYFAVARAFAPVRVTLRTDRPVWAGQQRASAQAWVWAETGVPAGSQVRIALRSADGRVQAEDGWTLDRAVTDPRAVGTLEAPLGAGADGDRVLAWDVSWTGPDGDPLDRDVVLATTGADLSALLDLPTASVGVGVQAGDDPDTWRVRVRHLGGPLVVGLQLLDARPFAAPGWAVCDGDPRPLLPGEDRALSVRWRGDRPGVHPRRLVVESWNTVPAPVDAEELRR